MAFVDKQTGISKRSGYFYEGKEIALTKDKINNRKPKRLVSKEYVPEAKRIEVATLFAVTRDFNQVSQLSGVSVKMLKNLSVEPWWDNIVSQVVREKNEELDAKLSTVIDKAVDVLSDRIQNGNVYVDRKTREHLRTPVNVKDTSIALDILFDKRQLIRGESTSNTKTVTYNDRLKTIRATFENLGKKAIDVTEESKELAGNATLVASIEEDNKDKPI
jgi:hypothetical protein